MSHHQLTSLTPQFVTVWRRPRQAVLTPMLLIGGALVLVVLAGRSRLGHWLRGFFDGLDVSTRRRQRHRLPHADFSPVQLREWILGRPKAFVAAELGPPGTAVVSTPPAPMTQTAFWRGDTWYYAIDPSERTAMAVRFQDDRACAVDFVEAPQRIAGES